MLNVSSANTEVWFHLTQNERGVSAEKGKKGSKVVVGLDIFLLWMKDSPTETVLRARLFSEGRIEPLTQSDVKDIEKVRKIK